jgi:hypothetical protein
MTRCSGCGLLCVVAVVKESNDPQSTTNRIQEAGTMRSLRRAGTGFYGPEFAPSEYLVRKAFRTSLPDPSTPGTET